MALVAYSDSDNSDDGTQQQPKAVKPAPVKKSFQKLVDSSDSNKIRVSLPSASPSQVEESLHNERPAKKPRLGGGGGLFSGMSAFLPAPKRSGDATLASSEAESGKKPGSNRGLGRGVNLKTGATPAFSREPPPPSYDFDRVDHTSSTHDVPRDDSVLDVKPSEVKLIGKATVFRPLSVARKNQRKKPLNTPNATGKQASSIKATEEQNSTDPKAPAKPKVSLFSMTQPEEVNHEPVISEEPLVQDEELHGDIALEFDQYNSYQAQVAQPQQTLDTIASSMNLDEATRRQLFGRRGKGGDMPINITNFNTDQEYAHNETIRASGDTVQHNTVRAIAPGKHSLKQLISVANSQKEAFEDAWAAGRKNKKESGNKYGW